MDSKICRASAVYGNRAISQDLDLSIIPGVSLEEVPGIRDG